MAAGEVLTGGLVPCHDGFMHVAAIVRPSFLVRLVALVYALLA